MTLDEAFALHRDMAMGQEIAFLTVDGDIAVYDTEGDFDGNQTVEEFIAEMANMKHCIEE